MLWRQSWLETRWHFLAGLVLLGCSAVATIVAYPEVLKLLALAPAGGEGALPREIGESLSLAREYRGYIWSEWFRSNLGELATLFAVLLGVAAPLTPSSGALFTLSLPVSRPRLLGVRAAVRLGELLVLVVVPSLLIPLLSPAVGQRYGLAAALVHGACAFVAVSVFLNLALLLSATMGGAWRPLLICLGVAFALALVERTLGRPSHGLFGVLSGKAYFLDGRVPWSALLASAGLSAALYWGAVASFARRDF